MGGSNAYLKTIIKIKQYYVIKYTVESLMHGERSVNGSRYEQGRPEAVGLSSVPREERNTVGSNRW